MSATPSAFPTPAATGSVLSETSHSTSSFIVATIIPVVLIVAIVVWGLLIFSGVIYTGRRLRNHSTPATPDYNEKSMVRPVEPKLWDVRMETVEVKPYLEDLHPLSVDLISDACTKSRQCARSWRDKLGSKLKPKKWRNRYPAPLSERNGEFEGQVTVFVAMPTPGGRAPGRPMHEFAIGTRSVSYFGARDEEKADFRSQAQTKAKTLRVDASPIPSSSSTEVPIMLDVCAYGYFF